MTGHKTRLVFERYNILRECNLVEAAKKLNVLLPAAPPPEGGSPHVRPSRAQFGHSEPRSRFPPESESLSFLESWRRRPDLNRGWRFCSRRRRKTRNHEIRRNSQRTQELLLTWTLTWNAENYEVFGREWDRNGTVSMARSVALT